MGKNTDLKRFESFLLKYFDQAAFADCYNDCDACKELGTQEDFVEKLSPYIKGLLENKQDNNISVNSENLNNYLENLYNQLKDKCDAILLLNNCKPSPCDAKLQVILQDVTPGGQYALYDTASYSLVDVASNILLHYNTPPPLSSGFVVSGPLYTDSEGNQDYVENDLGQMVKPEQLTLREFIQKFRPSWARTLAYWHPEYCYYRWCLLNSDSKQFDEQIKEMDGSTALGEEYLSSPTALLNIDPFFNTIASVKGKGACYKDAMEWELNHFSQTKIFDSHTEKNILEFVDYMLYCRETHFGESCIVNNDCRKRNREWEMYVAFYLQLKQKYDEMARKCWQPDCSNCYIGTDGFPVEEIPLECSATPSESWQSLLPSCECTTAPPDEPSTGCPVLTDIIPSVEDGCAKFTLAGGVTYTQNVRIGYRIVCGGSSGSQLTAIVPIGQNSALECLGSTIESGCSIVIDYVYCGDVEPGFCTPCSVGSYDYQPDGYGNVRFFLLPIGTRCSNPITITYKTSPTSGLFTVTIPAGNTENTIPTNVWSIESLWCNVVAGIRFADNGDNQNTKDSLDNSFMRSAQKGIKPVKNH